MIAVVHLPDPEPSETGRDLARIARVLRWLAAEGIESAVLALGDDLADACADGEPRPRTIRRAPAPARGAVASALRALEDRIGPSAFVVVDAARFEEFDLSALAAEHAASPAIATLALRHGATGATAPLVDMDRAGRILRIARGGAASDLELESLGTCIVEPQLLRHVPADGGFGLEEDLFPLVVRSGGILSGLCVVDAAARAGSRR